MMSVEDSGIYITRDDEGLVLTYSFQKGEHSREQLEELASQVLKHMLVDDEFLINNGFKREYGARASMKKSVPISHATPPVPREKRATLTRRVARTNALRLAHVCGIHVG